MADNGTSLLGGQTPAPPAAPTPTPVPPAASYEGVDVGVGANAPTYPMELSITPGERIPVEQMYQEREDQRLLEEQRSRVDLGPEALQRAAEGGARLEPLRRLTPNIESASEVVRDRAARAMQDPAIKEAVDKVVKTLTGATLGELQHAVETGRLPEHVSLKLMDPVGSITEATATRTAEESGLPPDVAQTVGSITGLLAGILFPGGTGKRAAKTAEEVERLRFLSSQQREVLGRLLRGEIPEAEARINLARIGGEESVKRTMSDLNKLHAERMAASRKTVTHAETIAQSKNAMSLEQALRIPESDLILNKDKATALRDLYVTASGHLETLRQRVLRGETGLEDQLYEAYLIASELAMKDELAGRALARGLEARKIESSAERAPLTMADLAKLRERFMGADLPDAYTLAQMMEGMGPEQRKNFMLKAWQGLRNGQNMLYEIWINGLLSSPPTHAANVLSNSLVAAWAPAERFLSATLDFGRDRSVFHGESTAMLYAWNEAVKEGVRMANEALRTGRSGFGVEKVERVGSISAEKAGLSSESTVGSVLDYFGAVVRSPGRALITEDAFFKGFNYRLELHAQAYRAARQEGLEGEAFARRMRQLVENPSPEIKARAEHFASVQTFNAELSELGAIGQIGRAGMTIADTLPMGRVAVPFVQTPTNLIHYAHERTPILNVISDTLWRDVLAGGERRALALGKVGTSAAVGGAFVTLAAAGIITGAGPADKQLRELKMATGWRPYSIKVGDTYYSFNRLDPLGLTLGILSDYAEIAGELPQGARLQFAAAAALAIQKDMVNKTYFQGLAQVLELLTSKDEARLKTFLAANARSVVPAGVRQLNRAYFDPYISNTQALTELDTLVNEMKASIPGYSKTLPARRNLWGDPVALPPGWGWDLVSPIYTGTEKRDPVTDELLRLKVRIPRVEGVLPIVGISRKPEQLLEMTEPRPTGLVLNPAEMDDYARMVGKGVQGEPPLKEALAALIRSPEYKQETDTPDGGKALLILRVIEAYKKAARAELLATNDALRELYERKIQERLDLLDPVKNPPAQSSSEQRVGAAINEGVLAGRVAGQALRDLSGSLGR